MTNTHIDDTLVNIQRTLEQAMVDEAYARQRYEMERNSRRKENSEDRTNRYLIGQLSTEYATHIEAFLTPVKKTGVQVQAARLLRDCGLEIETIAWLSLRALINVLSLTRKGARRTTLCRAIGEILHDEWRLRYFTTTEYRLKLARKIMADFDKRGYPRAWRKRVFKMYFQAEQLAWEGWTYEQKLHIGYALLVILKKNLGVIEFSDDETRVWLSDQFVDLVNSTNEANVHMFTLYKPMVVPPVKWDQLKNLYKGGYITHRVRKYPLIKGSRKADVDRLLNMDLSKVIPAINALQETPWRVNKAMLDAMSWAYYQLTPKVGDIGKLVCCLPVEMKPQPEGWPDVPEDVRKQYLHDCFLVHDRNRQDKSRRISAIMTLSIAKQMVHYDKIYYPHNLDSRGRAYPIPAFLNPQAADYSKALLEFADGKPIETEEQLNWLKIACANAYGYDKASLAERIQWVNDNLDMILSVGNDYQNDLRWTQASEPFGFLRGCMELRDFNTHGYGWVSHMAIPVDATCSGLQHYSAMLQDEVGGKSVNLVPGLARQDVYGDVATVTIRKLLEDGSEHARAWVQFGVNRKTTKRQVMVVPYAGKFSSCLSYTREAFEERLKLGEPRPWPASEDTQRLTLLAKYIWHAIDEVVVKAKEAMSWLSSSASAYSKVMNKTELPLHDRAIRWVTPDGFEVLHLREDEDRKRLNTYLDGTVKLIYFKSNGKLNVSDMSLAVAPNFVHSLDACHMRLTICEGLKHGITSYAMVHDSFGVHAALMPTLLEQCIKPSFVNMYKNHNVLMMFYDVVSKVTPIDLPPSKGELNLDGILQSEFFFS